MNGTLYAQIELAGIEFDVSAEFDADYVDNGIGPYEYWGAKGVHHAWCWEVQSIERPDFDCDPEWVIIEDIKARGWYWRFWNPLFWVVLANTMRQVEQEWRDFDPDSLMDEAKDAADNMDPPEPDYDED